MKPAPLAPELLYRTCDLSGLSFSTTTELEDLTEIVGQERALAAVRFGIGVRRPGYNMFAVGPAGTGKHTLIRTFLERQAATEPVPSDWCYVNNFDEPHKPRALRLPAGRAAALRDAMKRLVEELRAALPAAFESDDYRKRRQVIEEQFNQRREEAFGTLQAHAQERHIALVRTPMGLALAPMRDGDVLPPAEFHQLPPEEQEQLKRAIEDLQHELEDTVRKVPQWEREQREEVRKLNREVTRFAVGHLIEETRGAFTDLPDVLDYLAAVEHDVLENADDFLSPAAPQPTPQPQHPALEGLPGAVSGLGEAASFRRYQANVIVDHSASRGAPVIYEDHPTHQMLVGRAEHLARLGTLLTDFNLIKPGALHRANGGYLVLDARRLLTQGFAWETLKRALRSGEIRIESLEQLLSLVSTVSLEPAPIPLSLKVVLVGEPLLYYLLSALDPEFSVLFKVVVDFDERFDRTEATTMLYARMIATLARREHLRPLERAAVARVIERASRLAGDADKLSAELRAINDLLGEADYMAQCHGRDVITLADVDAAIDGQLYRSGRLSERVREEITRGTLLIDTSGAKVGQINGLSVILLGKHSFGRPSRITARIRLGKGEVVDIEREVELGGPLHSKGVLILTGFLGGRFGANRPLSLQASLVFEQSYGGVDGDSASSAELYALLSALADVPLRQDLAVTGSVNQRGEVQAIGGVNEKIEGFFDVCHARGLTGSQGVLIPAANVKHLMLRADVAAAATEGRFHIYPVTTLDEGIELLTGLPAGERDPDGHFPEGSINQRVEARLTELTERVIALNAGARGAG